MTQYIRNLNQEKDFLKEKVLDTLSALMREHGIASINTDKGAYELGYGCGYVLRDHTPYDVREIKGGESPSVTLETQTGNYAGPAFFRDLTLESQLRILDYVEGVTNIMDDIVDCSRIDFGNFIITT